MGRGPKKHEKRIATPKSWLLDKLTGIYAPRPSQGPHKRRESLPLVLILRNRLRLALSYRESLMILKDKEPLIKVDGKVRRDHKFPVGFMDVVSIDKTSEHYRVLYDLKGRFTLVSIKDKEAKFKVCRVVRKETGANRIPYIVTADARTIRFPHPDIQVHDSVRVDLQEGKITEFYKFEPGALAFVTAGNNRGRVGQVVHKTRHLGGFDIVSLRDSRGHNFATRVSNVYIIGKGGQMLKEIGTRARRDIEKLLDRHVRLFLFVRVQEQWRNDPRLLDELGIEERAS